VDAQPAGARVRVLNIGPAFYQGMELDPCQSQLEVSAWKRALGRSPNQNFFQKQVRTITMPVRIFTIPFEPDKEIFSDEDFSRFLLNKTGLRTFGSTVILFLFISIIMTRCYACFW
jgi:hypothetical protein